MPVKRWAGTGEGNEITKEVRRSPVVGDGRPLPGLPGVVAPAVWLSRSLRSLSLAALGDSPAVRRGFAAKSGEGVAWSGRRRRGGPELGGAAGGRDLGDAGAPGELERAKRVLDLVGWPV